MPRCQGAGRPARVLRAGVSARGGATGAAHEARRPVGSSATTASSAATPPTPRPSRGCSATPSPGSWRPTRPTASSSTRPGGTASTTSSVPPRSPTCGSMPRTASTSATGRDGRRATATRRSRATPASTGPTPSRSCPRLDVGYVWHAGVHAAEVAAGLKRIGFEIVSQVIWDKGLFAMGRSWYHWAHEPCWVVRRKGAKVPFLGSRDQAHGLAGAAARR